MPFYEKSEEWLQQSALLLEARPSSTRVTTRYHIEAARQRKAKKAAAGAAAAAAAGGDEAAQRPPRGYLELRTYDPVSGVALKYKTTKAAEVSRLVQMLGTLGRRMAALPEAPAAARAVDELAGAAAGLDDAAAGSGTQTPVAGGPAAAASSSQGQAQQPGAGGGKGKKKKGKR